MSRVGNKIIQLPSGVKVSISDTALRVEGPKGKLTTPVPPGISFSLKDSTLTCSRSNDDRRQRACHGLARALANNAVVGVTQGFAKQLDIVGVGYRATVEGRKVNFTLGYSHPVVFDIPEGVDVKVDKQGHVTVSGIDRQQVGQVAAEIRSFRKPDPYKQKGIRYTGEVLRKKAGKAGATGAK